MEGITAMLLWFICSLASYFIFVHCWRRKFDFYAKDRRELIFMSLFGPVSLVSSLLLLVFDENTGDGKLLSKKYDK